MGQELSFPHSFNDQRAGRILPSWYLLFRHITSRFTPDNDFNMNDYKKILLWIQDSHLFDPISYTIFEKYRWYVKINGRRKGGSVMADMFSVIGHRIEALCPIFAIVFIQ